MHPASAAAAADGLHIDSNFDQHLPPAQAPSPPVYPSPSGAPAVADDVPMCSDLFDSDRTKQGAAAGQDQDADTTARTGSPAACVPDVGCEADDHDRVDNTGITDSQGQLMIRTGAGVRSREDRHPATSSSVAEGDDASGLFCTDATVPSMPLPCSQRGSHQWRACAATHACMHGGKDAGADLDHDPRRRRISCTSSRTADVDPVDVAAMASTCTVDAACRLPPELWAHIFTLLFDSHLPVEWLATSEGASAAGPRFGADLSRFRGSFRLHSVIPAMQALFRCEQVCKTVGGPYPPHCQGLGDIAIDRDCT